ncbi:MAG: ATP-binding protein [Burkholderiaceae bacterium]
MTANTDSARLLELTFAEASAPHSCAVELRKPDVRELDQPRMFGEHPVRFYVTVPLVGRNEARFGVLHLLGSDACRLDDFKMAALMDIAAIAADEIELHLYNLLARDMHLPAARSRGKISVVRNSSRQSAKPRRNSLDKEEGFQSLIGLLSDWHWEQDESGRFILIAETGQTRTPAQFRQYIGKTMRQIPGMQMAEPDWRSLDNAMARHQSFQEKVFQWQDANNVLRYLSVSGQPVFNAEGRFKGYRGVMKDVSEKIRIQKELARSNAALRELSEAQQAFREAERKRIARELHEELAQILASSRMELCLLQRDLQPASLSRQRLDVVDRMIGSSILSLRKLATDLRPSSLDEGGLYYAMRALLKTVSENAGIECRLLANETDLTMDEPLSTTIFRLVEECLNNIDRHANARKAVVRIYLSENSVEIRVQDDGRGIRREELHKTKAFGLMEMRERVQKMRGKIDIRGLQGKGTCVAISLPKP